MDFWVIEHQLRLVIGQSSNAVDDRLAELDFDDLAGPGHLPDHTEGKPIVQRMMTQVTTHPRSCVGHTCEAIQWSQHQHPMEYPS